ncbi:MAG: Verru_Chthon cassette protein B [Verrucomicrobiota bacterium]
MHLKDQNSNSAFSLVEVTIAMAIAAVALVSLIGLLPQGMSTMREAGDEAIEARIHQQVLNELQMTPFGGPSLDGLKRYRGLEIFYDDQGEEIGNSVDAGGDTVKDSFDHIYTARITIAKSGESLPDSVGGASFSGFSFDGKTTNDKIVPVVIEIGAIGGLGDSFDWDSDENRRLISTYQTYLVDMGKNYTE